MANSYKILGQVNPTAITEVDLYTTPSSSASICSSISICNTDSSKASFRVSISKGGNTTSIKDYLYYDVALAGNDTFIATIGITLSTGDVIRVYASTNKLSFQLFGTEII